MGYVTEVWVWGNRILIKFLVKHHLEEQPKGMIFKFILQLTLMKIIVIYSENHKKHKYTFRENQVVYTVQ
jgi:hypothetical protein